MKNISFFSNSNLFEAGTQFYEELNIPLNTIEEQAFAKEDILQNTYNPKSEALQLIDKVYFLGMTDDQSFSSENTVESLANIQKLTTDYEGLLVIAVELKLRENGLEPTRSQLAEISRAFNREFMFTPVTVLFRYGNYIALANSERSAYKAKYKEGEKVGKISLLRDIKYNNPHTGHLQILQGLTVPAKISTFKDLYKHWGEVFSVNVLNRKFYLELSNWYFWAIKNVTFPGEPTLDDALLQGKEYKDLQQEHKATNVIRMLTRLLFVWFMKEKKLIPDDLFDLEVIKKDILNEISPYQEVGMFTEHNKDSVYYKAILQNLFFATLNCPIKSDGLDKRERGFRGEGYGTNRGIDYLLRYKKYFTKPDAFLQKLNDVVPFLNGGLFECLDDKFNNTYIDGFSDQMTKGEQLIVPDYLFFGLEEEADLSEVIGIADKKNKNAAVKGLINILKSYKFTITENTPIEEEVALDPELLGKVFENLLASYNPETKTTARKQTGSFYTPREIVNYMVDESLIAYLKNKIQSAETVHSELGASQTNLFGNKHKVGQTSLMQQHSGSELKDKEERLDELLHNLVSYNPENPFAEFPQTSKIILEQLDTCTILDPACGSGAFPMGVLQKMVHILEKLDPDNRIWKEVQIEKAKKESDEAFDIADKKAREIRLLEINDAFDEDINNPDYARKLFLIENCIYGVDIQPIATQISKLRFFISLVVEQNVDRSKDNFGIRPLPNLETKFVAANTLIGIEKENTLFSTTEIKALEQELKRVRNKLFGARTKDTKLKYRTQDKELRLQIADKLKANGFPVASAEKLASWDPFDQNASSSFFDPEWMFDIKEGFDIVIGNPPYMIVKSSNTEKNILKQYSKYYSADFKINLFALFLEKSILLGKNNSSIHNYIIPDSSLNLPAFTKLREAVAIKNKLLRITFYDQKVFESAEVGKSIILTYQKIKPSNNIEFFICNEINEWKLFKLDLQDVKKDKNFKLVLNDSSTEYKIIQNLENNNDTLSAICNIYDGINPGCKELKNIFINKNKNTNSKKVIDGKDFNKFSKIEWSGFFVQYDSELVEKVRNELKKEKKQFTARIIKKVNFFERNKIVTRQTSDTIIATIDREGFFTKNSVHSTLIKSELQNNISLENVCLLLNSFFIEWFYKKKSMEEGRLFPQVKIERLNDLPIPKINVLIQYNNLALNLYEILAYDKKYFSSINPICNAFVFQLYFPNSMENVTDLIEKDLAERLFNRNFKELNNDQKTSFLLDLEKKWTNPNNEILRIISSFSENSPHILKVILQS